MTLYMKILRNKITSNTTLNAATLYSKTSMGHMLKKSNKIGKKDNAGVNNKHTSMLKKELVKKSFSF